MKKYSKIGIVSPTDAYQCVYKKIRGENSYSTTGLRVDGKKIIAGKKTVWRSFVAAYRVNEK